MISVRKKVNAYGNGSPKHKRSQFRKKIDRQKTILLILPMIKVVMFSFIPLVGLVMAFQDYRVNDMFLSPWTGWKNFEFVFRSNIVDKLIVNAAVFNVLFVATSTLVSLVLGLFLFQLTNKWALKGLQAVYFLPVFISWPLVGVLLGAIIGANEGILTNFIYSISGTKIGFYDDPKYWRFILTLVNMWKSSGLSGIMYYCILLGMDKGILEAAEIDGAGTFRKMWTISLANLKNMVLIGLITSCGNIIRIDGSMMWFTVGTNMRLLPVTDVFETYQMRALLNGAKLGQPVALGLFQGVVGLILTLIVNFVIKKVDKDASLF